MKRWKKTVLSVPPFLNQDRLSNIQIVAYSYNVLACYRYIRKYIYAWRSECFKNSNLMCYSQFKMNIGIARYISAIDIKLCKLRCWLATFCCLSHALTITTCHYYDLPREYRFCSYCKRLIEDELQQAIEVISLWQFVILCKFLQELIGASEVGAP